MATVFIPSLLRKLNDEREQIVAPGSRVRDMHTRVHRILEGAARIQAGTQVHRMRQDRTSGRGRIGKDGGLGVARAAQPFPLSDTEVKC